LEPGVLLAPDKYSVVGFCCGCSDGCCKGKNILQAPSPVTQKRRIENASRGLREKRGLKDCGSNYPLIEK